VLHVQNISPSLVLPSVPCRPIKSELYCSITTQPASYSMSTGGVGAGLSTIHLHLMSKFAVSYLMRLVAGFPPWRYVFDPKSGHVGFAVNKIAPVVGFHRVFRFPLPILIPPTAIHSSSPIIQGWYNRSNSGRCIVVRVLSLTLSKKQKSVDAKIHGAVPPLPHMPSMSSAPKRK
jgi:hypothetical protein